VVADDRRVSGLAGLAARRAVWVVVAWLALAGALNVFVPQIEEVAAKDSTAVVPEKAPSIVAVDEMGKAFGNGGANSFVVIAMERDGGLAPTDEPYAARLARVLTKDDENVTFVQDIRKDPELLSALTSEDGEARYLLVGITGVTGAPSSIHQVTAVRDVAAELAPDGLDVAVTGPTATIVDLATETEHSVIRITIVSIGLIALLLWLIYRSFAVMGVVLTIVGLGLGLARALTALCGELGIFTVSTFSGTFLTAVVLGAGTDYAIFLVSRYQELRRAGVPPEQAAATAGARITGVIVGSALTVVLACGCMLLADLGFFSTTGPAIAVSVAINLLVAITLTPALLALAGRRGWCEPRVRADKWWPRLAGLVVAHPARMLAVALVPLLALAALAPALAVSYDTRDSQSEDTESNRGYALLDRHFPVNEILPDYVLIQADHDLRNPRDLALLERAASAVAQEDGVVMVRSITRPLGEPITDASVARQAGIVGVRLDHASRRIGKGEQGATRLADGAGQLGEGADQLSDGSGRLADGADRAIVGADRLATGTADLSDGVRRLLDGADDAVGGTGQLAGGMEDLARGLDTGADQVRLAVDGLGLAYDALRTKSLTCNVDPACRQAREGIRQIWVAERDQLLPGLRQAATAAQRLADGTVGLQDGLRQLRDGLRRAHDGADRLADGQRLFADRLDDLADGADQLADGADQLADGAGRLSDGTEQVAATLPQLRHGLSRAAAYLRRTDAVAHDDPAIGGFYLPPSALKDQRFAAAMRLFLSPDGRTARFAVLGATDAFGHEASARTHEIQGTVEQAFHDTRLDDADVSMTGMAATNADLADFSQSDMRVVALAALVAVFLVLLVLLRSLVAAAMLMATVVLSYASAIGLSVLVWQVVLGTQLDWTVMAVSFTILVAVGADYNLLLTKRMHEEAPDGSREGIARATAATGSVITSAGVIFAASMFALMAGSVSTMAHVGFTIGAGLLLDTFVVRSLLVPAAATLLGRRLWWPGGQKVSTPA
jgi:RND superfamily putative drug exporter